MASYKVCWTYLDQNDRVEVKGQNLTIGDARSNAPLEIGQHIRVDIFLVYKSGKEVLKESTTYYNPVEFAASQHTSEVDEDEQVKSLVDIFKYFRKDLVHDMTIPEYKDVPEPCKREAELKLEVLNMLIGDNNG